MNPPVHFGLTWNLLPLLAALVVINGAGSLLARWMALGKEFRTSDPSLTFTAPRRPAWGWSYLLGMAWIVTLLQIPLAIGGHIARHCFSELLLLCAAMTAAEWVLRHRDRKNQAIGSEDNSSCGGWLLRRTTGWLSNLPLLPRILTLLCLAVFVWFAAISTSITFDSRATFGLKARVLYDTGDLTGEDFHDPDRLHFHSNYPLLLPLVEATLYAAQGSQQDVGLQLLFAGFVFACGSILVEEIGRFESPQFAAAWGAIFLLLPLSMALLEGGGLSGSADFPLAAFVLAAVIAAGRCIAQPTIRGAILAGSMLGAAAFTKQEGTVWVAAVGVAAIATMLVRRARPRRTVLRAAVVMFGVASGCVLLVALTRHIIPTCPYFRSFEQALHWNWLIAASHRTTFILDFAYHKLFFAARFDFIWPLVLLPMLLLRRPQPTATVTFWRITVVTISIAYFAILMITPLHLEYQLRTAFHRLVAHFLPITMLIAAEQLFASRWTHQMQWILTGRVRDEDDVRWQRISTGGQIVPDPLPERKAATRAA